MCGFYKFAYQARWRENSAPTVMDRITSFTASIPFPRTSVLTPKPASALEPALASLQLNIMQAYTSQSRTKSGSNLTEGERRGLRKLLKLRKELRYSVSDKGGDFVVLTQTLDKKISRDNISDTTLYERSSLRDFDKVSNYLRSTIKRVLGKIMNTRTVKRFIPTFPTVPTYYALIKTHKIPAEIDLQHMDERGIKVRPIISSCGGPSDRISWFLVKLLSPLLRHVAAHITNVEGFISALNNCELPKDVCYASFDAVSLYTNVNNDEAVHAILELLQKHQGEVQTFGLGENDLRELLVATLACNIFQFDGEFYAQKRGLAMGLRISPLLAIVYLDRIERKSLISGILFYKRYIDDVFVISSNADELHIMLENLNECDPNVKFTSELPDEDGFLPFLNTKVRIYQSKKQFRWYKKPQSKNILLHSRSAHPQYMKVNMVRNFVVTKKRTCSEDSEEVDESVKQILEDNGYTTVEARSWRPHFVAGGIPLVLPFLNEQCAKDVNQIAKSSGLPIKLIFRPPPNLRSLLVSSRIYEEKCGRSGCTYCTERKICQLQGTVYMVTCNGCGQKYIGETGRPLHKRLDEHLRAMRNPSSYPNNSFSHHRTLHHTREDPPGVRVTVLHRSLESPLERKLLEALAIKRLMPEINSKEELMDILRLIT
ncbi:hypothetical protein Y032_0604g557 [Ancylostoma ceylanicum]|uniref:C2H2-type domain-containing protein n=2 Tax=Ancylostoma ceylanicum TaxID=53326 RepID=A0A016WNP1_9BILA|nr:hypothetical protein Y032_0604g557 [Ancylostoma ceylanicum]